MKIKPATKETLKLYRALNKQGIKGILEYYDKHKHIDLCIPEANIYIELDGLQHYTNPNQILSDFGRNYYSDKEGYNTIHIPNLVLDKCFYDVVKAIVAVVKKRGLKK